MRGPYVRNVVGDFLSRPSHRHCRHRCERPLRMDAPSTGWVTVLAGLLARGSLPFWSSLPSFPVAMCWTLGSPLTVAGAATASFEFDISNSKYPCSLFRPRNHPGNQHDKMCP